VASGWILMAFKFHLPLSYEIAFWLTPRVKGNLLFPVCQAI